MDQVCFLAKKVRMIGFLALVVAGCVIAAATALVRGLLALHADGAALRNGDEQAIARFGRQQNRMMSQRVIFQALAILMVALISALFAAH